MNTQRSERIAVGRRLREVRERAHITVADAATAAGVQPLAIEKWERGSGMPSLLELRPLLELYGIMACEVLYDTNPLQMNAEHVAELRRAAKDFSPALQARVEFLLSILSKGREPCWKVKA